jgi:hypothetical protein
MRYDRAFDSVRFAVKPTMCFYGRDRAMESRVCLTPHVSGVVMQADNKIVADVFRLQTEVSRLRAEVDKLNGPKDTVRPPV